MDEVSFDCQPNVSNKAISSLYFELLESNTLNLHPAYQRSLVWDHDQKSNLIDSVMKNIPMPIFLLYRHQMEEECIDGQNRLNTIKEYIEQIPDEDKGIMPWAWKIFSDEKTEYVYYNNQNTKAIMLAFCEQKKKKAKTPSKEFRLMRDDELKRFRQYQVNLSEIKQYLTFEQRKAIFTRWQNGTGITQCDKFKNNDNQFCLYIINNDVESRFLPKICQILKSGKQNWLWDLYRLTLLFLDPSKDKTKDKKEFILSSIKVRTDIAKNHPNLIPEQYKQTFDRVEKFLTKVSPLAKLKFKVPISFLLQFAYFYLQFPPEINAIMEKEEFILEYASFIQRDDLNYNTLNNGPNVTEFLDNWNIMETEFKNLISKHSPPPEIKNNKKTKIPDNLKTDVWNKYVGKSNGVANCLCCGVNEISSRDFECAHIKAEANGGLTILENLRPICSKCNRSMGTQHMEEFMKKFYPFQKLIY
jgi:hypothetical protein